MKLYPYQEAGVRFLVGHERAYLADEMGLGKTIQAIEAARRLGVENVLVFCPAVAVPNWKREWATWWPHGPAPRVISYAKAIRRITKPPRQDFWDLVILDEAHYCKTPSAKRTRVALKVAQRAKRAWLLSGTPVLNDATELWPPFKYLWPDLAAPIRTAGQWLQYYTWYEMTEFGPRVYGLRHGKQLRAKLHEFMLRRKLAGVALDLPPLRIDRVLLDADTDEFREALTQALDGADLEALMAEAESEGVLSTLRRLLGTYKAPRIGKILAEECDDRGHQLVVLAHHRDTLHTLESQFMLAGVKHVYMDGDTPAKVREQNIDAFRAGKAQVLVAQQTTAGVSLNLQNAHEVVLVEPAWTPAENIQAVKRIHRIGQQHPCRARLFAVAGTLDEWIMNVLARKARMIADLIEEEA